MAGRDRLCALLIDVRHRRRRVAYFTIIGDRLPVAAMIVLIYFGIRRSHRVLSVTMLVVLVALVI